MRIGLCVFVTLLIGQKTAAHFTRQFEERSQGTGTATRRGALGITTVARNFMKMTSCSPRTGCPRQTSMTVQMEILIISPMTACLKATVTMTNSRYAKKNGGHPGDGFYPPLKVQLLFVLLKPSSILSVNVFFFRSAYSYSFESTKLNFIEFKILCEIIYSKLIVHCSKYIIFKNFFHLSSDFIV